MIYGDLVSDDPALEVPHPRQHQRRFVLVPVCDVAPDMVHPVLGRTMRDLLADLPVEPGDLTAHRRRLARARTGVVVITPDVLLPLWEAHRDALDHPVRTIEFPASTGCSTTGRSSSG